MNRVMTIAAEIENTPNEEIRNNLFRLVRLAYKVLASERLSLNNHLKSR